MLPTAGRRVAPAQRACHHPDRRPHRPDHSVHRRAAEPARTLRSHRAVATRHSAYLQHGAQEVRRGGATDRARARNRPGQCHGRRLGRALASVLRRSRLVARHPTHARNHAETCFAGDQARSQQRGGPGHLCSYLFDRNKDFDSALYYFDRSLRLNPSLAFIWALSAVTYCYIGEPDIALQRLERYGELAPLDPHYSWFEHLYTIAYTFKGAYDRAVIVGRR